MFVPDPYKASMDDVSIHVSYDRDEDSPPQQQLEQQPSNDDGSIVHSEDTGKVVDSEAVDGSIKEVSAGEGVAEKEETSTEQHAAEPSEQVPLVSSDEANMVETQEKQLSTSSGQEQTENQPTEGSTTVEGENKDEP